MKRLRIGYSPCPNDTFIFAHLGKVVPGIEFEPVLADVETLNQWAMEGRLEVTKLSIGALGMVRSSYGLLHSGCALGRGCGPIVVSCPGRSSLELLNGLVASPGRWTTAALLLGLYLGQPPRFMHMEFSRVMDSVLKGEADFGLVIHEGRFTFQERGLEMIVDLGQWWEERTSMPIALGAMAIRRDLGEGLAQEVDKAIRDSLARSTRGEKGTMEYVLANAQELCLEVVEKHIQLYVTDFTWELGQEGSNAVAALLAMAEEANLIPKDKTPLLAY